MKTSTLSISQALGALLAVGASSLCADTLTIEGDLKVEQNVSTVGKVGIGLDPAPAGGLLQFPAGTTPAMGIQFGEDAHFYRSHAGALATNAQLSAGGGLITQAAFVWGGAHVDFPGGVANQVSYIDFGTGNFWGWMEVSISSDYYGQKATGVISKRFEVGRNGTDTGVHMGTSELLVAHGAIATNFKIGEPEISSGRLRIPVYHLTSTNNPLHVRIEGMRTPVIWGESTQTFLGGITLTTPAVVANTATREFPYTRSDRYGFGAPPTAGRIQLSAGTTEAGGIYWGNDTNLYRSAANTLKTDDILLVVDKLGLGTNAPTEKLDVVGNAKISGTLTVAGQSVVTTNQLSSYQSSSGSGAGLTNIQASAITASGVRSDETFLRGDNTWAIPPSGSGGGTGVTDGNKGDVTVSANGTIWTVNGGPLDRANHTGTQPWSTLSDTPTTVAAYGITDAVTRDVEGEVTLPGSTTAQGDITVKNNAVIRISPAGDIDMGAFTAGTNPNPDPEL